MSEDKSENKMVDFSQVAVNDEAIKELIQDSAARRNVRRLGRQERKRAEREQKRAETRKERMKQRLPNRATYDLPPGMKAKIEQLAEQQETTATMVASVLLAEGIKMLYSGELQLEERRVPSKSVRYTWNLVPDWKIEEV